MTLIAAALALTIGFSMGLLGGGCSIIAVPALTFVLHFPPKDAVVTSLAIIGAAAATGAISALWRGVLPLGLAAVVGLGATAGAYAGAIGGAHLADHLQMRLLAITMLIASVVMWRRAGRRAEGPPHADPLRLAALGLGVGAITGLVGVGGGFLIVPALVIGARQPMRQATATSLFVIALAAFAALPAYRGRVTLDWAYIAPFAVVATGGVLAQYLPQRRLQQAFAAALVVLASYVLTQA